MPDDTAPSPALCASSSKIAAHPAEAQGILPGVEWITLALAAYGAALSTMLGYRAWQKDRYSVRFFVSYLRRHDWYGLVVNVVNTGFRPVELVDVYLEAYDIGRYLNTLDSELGLPTRLDEGQQITLEFHAEDVEPSTTALVIRDTHRREHRLDFAAGTGDGLQALRETVEETEPSLFAKGQERIGAIMRRNAAETRSLMVRSPIED
jgi:hypothetical protein